MEAANISPEDIDLIIVATISPDKIFPNTACFIQKRIGAQNATCFSVEAACTGFVYIFTIGAAMINLNEYLNSRKTMGDAAKDLPYTELPKPRLRGHLPQRASQVGGLGKK